MDKVQITKAIGTHGMWKNRLKSAISGGTADTSSATASKPDGCEFGKWLASVPASERTAQWTKVSELHRTFHLAVGDVLRKLEAGDKAGAEKATDAGSAFANASASCTLAMLEWSKQVS
jgi:hypothetical protein